MDKIRVKNDDVRDIVHEEVRYDILETITEADVIPIMQHYTQLVGDGAPK